MKKLKVWWKPQIPCKSFEVEVATVEVGVLLMDVLSNYDRFQFQHRIKPDYCNVGGLMMWEEELNDWTDWCDEETGEDDPQEYLRRKHGF